MHDTITAIDTLDELLDAHAAVLGHDFMPYRNHTYRVVNLCMALSPDAPADADTNLEKIAIAAAFHDLGIWTDGTFDYLRPSAARARVHLACGNHSDWMPEITGMILEHHKITRFRGDPRWLAEPFRRADWIDVTGGLRTFGLARSYVRGLFSTWPSAGFHKRLVQFSLARLKTHPWSPLPMLRL